TMSETSLRLIHPLDTTSWEIRGIMDRPPKLVKPILTKLQNSLRRVRITAVRPPSLIVFTDQNAADNADHHKCRTAHIEKQVEAEGGRREDHAGRKAEGPLDQIDGRAGDDRHNGGAHAGHGSHDPQVLPEK